MAGALTRARPPTSAAPPRYLAIALVWLGVAAVSLQAAIVLPGTPIVFFLGFAFGAICLWMFLSPRYEWTLAVLLLYVALADGFIRLRTGVSELTLLRDGLLYAIVIGAVFRELAAGRRVEAPPLTGWVVAFVAVVLVQLANPAATSFTHSLVAVRPHLEWVPLFFLGYAMMRSTRRLRAFFVLLLVVAFANGAANLVQLNLTLEEFAAWGPGYQERVLGGGDVDARFYKAGEDPFTGEEDLRTRPFGLGSDIGFSGLLAALALPGGLALVASARNLRTRALLYTPLAAGAVFGVITSAQRTGVIAAVIAACAFALAASSRRRAPRVLAGFVLTGLLTVVVGLALAGGSSGAFNRYQDITPTRVFSTTYDYREGTLALVPRYAAEFPLGAGLGSLGPAAGLEGAGRPNQELNGESEATFLLVELGVPGFLVLLALNVRLLVGAWRRVRRLVADELRILLAAVLAALVAIFATWIVGAPSATTPGAPYFWFAAGTLSYWLFRRPRQADQPSTALSGREGRPESRLATHG
jgi:hypothetical protein